MSKYDNSIYIVNSGKVQHHPGCSAVFLSIKDIVANLSLYKNKIDIMLLCGGSFNDLESQSRETLLYFDCINTFDNHKKIASEYEQLNSLAKKTRMCYIKNVEFFFRYFDLSSL